MSTLTKMARELLAIDEDLPFRFKDPYHTRVGDFELHTFEQCWAGKPLIDAVLDKLSDYTSTDLLNIIHNQKPWKMAYYCYNGCPISLSIIKEYFKLEEFK